MTRAIKVLLHCRTATDTLDGRGGGGGGLRSRRVQPNCEKLRGKLREIAGKLQENCGKITGKLRCCNQTKLNLPKPQGATILHRSLRMLKQIESSTGIRITTTSGPQYHHKIEA